MTTEALETCTTTPGSKAEEYIMHHTKLCENVRKFDETLNESLQDLDIKIQEIDHTIQLAQSTKVKEETEAEVPVAITTSSLNKDEHQDSNGNDNNNNNNNNIDNININNDDNKSNNNDRQQDKDSDNKNKEKDNSGDNKNNNSGNGNSSDVNKVDYETLSRSCVNTNIGFGKTYEECELIQLPGYGVPVPSGLEGFKRRLLDGGGFNLEGIFRLRGKEASIRAAKALLNSGGKVSELKCTPIELAQMLKGWFREVLCDDPGFISIKLLEAQTQEEAKQAFIALTEPKRSILLWTFDLWIEVEKYREKNKMTLQSLSIMFSPNLVRSNDPIIFLQYQKEAQRVLEKLAHLRANGELQLDTPAAEATLYTKPTDKRTIPVEYIRVVTTENSRSGTGIGALCQNRCHNINI